MVSLYIELSYSFLIGRKPTVSFRSQHSDVINADYKVIMSRTLKVTGNHVKLTRFQFFLVPCIIRQLLDSVFVISRIAAVMVFIDSCLILLATMVIIGS